MEHAAGYCRNCGQDLHDVEVHPRTVRQEVEIPPVYPRYIEHQSLTRLCPCCGLENKGDFPPDVKVSIQYGSSIQSIISYLSVCQYLPYNRIKTLLRDMFCLNLSEGSIDNILESMSRKPDGIYREIQSRTRHQTVVGSDETGCYSGGKNTGSMSDKTDFIHLLYPMLTVVTRSWRNIFRMVFHILFMSVIACLHS
ncbi:MAG: transposase [Prevotella sp.]|nr:transposase [Prevotella sp.]